MIAYIHTSGVRRSILAAIAASLILATGCGRDAGAVDGRVITNDDLAASSISPLITVEDNRYSPVSNVLVYVAIDEAGKKKIASTTTDPEGYYRIRIRDLPAAEDKAGYYYLCVEKAGYERYCYKVGFGPLATFRHNSILLRRLE